MPWRRPRKRVERASDIRRSEEEALEVKAEHAEEDEAVELAALDGASIVEAATGEPEDDREPGDLASKLSDVMGELDLDGVWRLLTMLGLVTAGWHGSGSLGRTMPIASHRP